MAEGFIETFGLFGNGLQVNDSSLLDVVGNIDIVFRVTRREAADVTTPDVMQDQSGATVTDQSGDPIELNDGLTPKNQRLLIKGGATSGAGNYNITFNALGLYFSAKVATTDRYNDSSYFPSLGTWPNGQVRWVRVTRTTAGVYNWYLASDTAFDEEPIGWGSPVATNTSAHTGALASNNEPLFIGCDHDGASPYSGEIKRVIVRNGIGGPIAFDTGGLDTPAADATAYSSTSQNAVVVRSSGRGIGFLANGMGESGDASTWPGATGTLDVYSGAAGLQIEGVESEVIGSQVIPVELGKRYQFSFAAKAVDPPEGVTPFLYGIVDCLDADGLSIQPYHTAKYPGSTLTTLAAPLVAGNTAITLTSSAGWASTASEDFQRIIGFFPAGPHPAYTYTRHVSCGTDNPTAAGFEAAVGAAEGNLACWNQGAISGNVITLASAYWGPTWPSGTPVANMQSGSRYHHPEGQNSTPTNPSWTLYGPGVFGGGGPIAAPPATATTVVGTNAGPFADDAQGWRWGTASVRVGWRVNAGMAASPTPITRISSITFAEETGLLIRQRSIGTIFGTGVPSSSVVKAFEADVVRVASWVDIYESDNLTLWRGRVPFLSGTVSVDMARSERRNFDATIADDGSVGYGPGAFWYDKILKPYRGVTLSNGDTWVTQLGEFLPDSITRPHFPDTIQASCRDFSKKLILDKFPDTTTFAAALNVGTVIQTIAANGGITKFDFQPTASLLPVPVTFERGSERWKAMTELAAAIGFEVFFNSFGCLVFRPYVDPLTAPLTHTFQTGLESNLVNFSRTTSDSFLFNDVVVYGTADANALVYGRATNTNINSPTRVAAIGRRLKSLGSQFVADNAAADAIAASYLKVSGLEQYDMSLAGIVVPWLEAGDAVEVLVPSAPGDPTRFLLTNFSIPLSLADMSGTAKRVVIVG